MICKYSPCFLNAHCTYVVILTIHICIIISRYTRGASLCAGGESWGSEHNQRGTHQIHYISVGQAWTQPQGIPIDIQYIFVYYTFEFCASKPCLIVCAMKSLHESVGRSSDLKIQAHLPTCLCFAGQVSQQRVLTAEKTSVDTELYFVQSNQSVRNPAAQSVCVCTLTMMYLQHCHVSWHVCVLCRFLMCCVRCVCVTAWQCAQTSTWSVTTCCQEEICYCRPAWSTT